MARIFLCPISKEYRDVTGRDTMLSVDALAWIDSMKINVNMEMKRLMALDLDCLDQFQTDRQSLLSENEVPPAVQTPPVLPALPVLPVHPLGRKMVPAPVQGSGWAPIL